MVGSRDALWLTAVSLLAGTLASAQVPHQEQHPPRSTSGYIQTLEDPSRDTWQQPEKVIKSLGLKPGERVADLGAGPGYFTLRHISDRPTYYPLLLLALEPGGRLVNIDFHKRSLPVGPPVKMKIPKLEMIREAEFAGFCLIQNYEFLKFQYFVVFARQ